eukprot:jgi/Mesvir1/2385/Mv22134-RA.2
MGDADAALADARRCVELRPNWDKGHYRLGCALIDKGDWLAAAEALQRGLATCPGGKNKAIEDKLATVREVVQRKAGEVRASVIAKRHELVAALREARRNDRMRAMIKQHEEQLVPPDWVAEDWEWAVPYRPAQRKRGLKGGRAKFVGDVRKRGLLDMCRVLAELEQPRRALRVLHDTCRLQAYENAIMRAVETHRADPGGARVVVCGVGSAVLAMVAARCGAAEVWCIEQGRLVFRMAQRLVEDNRQALPGSGSSLHLLQRPLEHCYVRGEPPPPEVVEGYRQHMAALAAARKKAQQEGEEPVSSAPQADATGDARTDSNGAVASKDDDDDDEDEDDSPEARARKERSAIAASPDWGPVLPCRANVVVADLTDHTLLGLGVIPALRHARRYLLEHGNASVIPARATVHACLAESRLQEVSGFDLHFMNAYKWHPYKERVHLPGFHHRRLSQPFPVCTVDLREASAPDVPAASIMGTTHRGEWKPRVPITSSGVWNCVTFWYELELDDLVSATVATWHEPQPSREMPSPQDGAPKASVLPSTNAGIELGAVACDGVRQGSEGAVGSNPFPLAVAHSYGQAVQYVAEHEVSAGDTLPLRVTRSDYELIFHNPAVDEEATEHTSMVPRWHFDMLLDEKRNGPYDAAIRAVVEEKRATGVKEVVALDIGAGSGLLSLMAARAGADRVWAVEHNKRMCDVGEECVVMNGAVAKVIIVNKDLLNMSGDKLPDGSPPDIDKKADVLIYEVFDSGLIGEGVLHMLHHAFTYLLYPGATITPSGAVVLAAAIEMRVEEAAGFDVSAANTWRYRPSYQGLELGTPGCEYRLLSEPVEVFVFDFYDHEGNMQPLERRLEFAFNSAGVFNHVAFWFELQMDEDGRQVIRTGPSDDKGASWQQAVQQVPEVRVASGQTLPLVAKHDTYGITFELDTALADVTPLRTRVPLVDPAWMDAYARVKKFTSEIGKSIAFNPKEAKKVAQAAVAIGTHPFELDIDAETAADFCTRFMG